MIGRESNVFYPFFFQTKRGPTNNGLCQRFCIRQNPRNPEIAKLNPVVRIQENVERLDVPVQNFFAVDVFEKDFVFDY